MGSMMRVMLAAAGGGVGGGSPGAWLQYDASTITGIADGGQIFTLFDQSGNGRDTVGGGAAGTPPFYEATGWDGTRPCIRFPGQSWFQTPSLASLTEADIFLVIKADNDPAASTSTSQHWRLGTDANDSHYPWTDGSLYDDAGTDTRRTVGNPTPALTSARLYNVTTTASEWTARLDTSVLYTDATNTVAWYGGPTLGGQLNSGVTHSGVIARVAEFLIYATKRTAGERTAIEAALKTKWGLAGY